MRIAEEEEEERKRKDILVAKQVRAMCSYQSLAVLSYCTAFSEGDTPSFSCRQRTSC